MDKNNSAIRNPRYRKKSKIGNARYAIVAACVFIALSVFSSYKIICNIGQYKASNLYYQQTNYDWYKNNVKKPTKNIDISEFVSIVPDNDQLADYPFGKDVIGYIAIPDTTINYPVAQTDNNSYYCYHLPDGEYNICGTIFMDSNKSYHMTNKNTILYGHHMNDGSMFAELMNYKNQDYFDSHTSGKYISKDGAEYKIAFCYGIIVDALYWENMKFGEDKNFDKLIEYSKKNSVFKSGFEITAGDNIITLCTCTYETNDARFMLIGKVEEINEIT